MTTDAARIEAMEDGDTPISVLEQAVEDVTVDDEVVPEDAKAEAPAQEVPTQEEAPAPTSEEAPVTEKTPEPPLPSAPNEEMQRRSAELEQREAALYQQQIEQARHQQRQQEEQGFAGYQERLEEEGLSASVAESVVNRERGLRAEIAKASAAVERERQINEGRHNAAVHFSNLYGVSYADIATMNSPEEMETAGKAHKVGAESNSRIEQLEKEIADMKQREIMPGQVFDEGKEASVAEGADLERGIGLGTIPVTSDNLRKLADYQRKQGFGI